MSLEIIPPKQKKNKKSKINPILPQPPFLMSILGPSASGKGVLLSNLLTNKQFGYNKYFQSIYYISPTIMNDKTGKQIRNDDNIITVSDMKVIENMDQFFKGILEDQERNGNEKTLLILDDMMDYLGKDFSALCSRFRHSNLSIILSLQHYKKIPVVCRNNTYYWCIFKTHSEKEIKNIMEEIGSQFPDFEGLYKEAVKDKYHFLYIDIRNRILYKDFKEILYKY